VVDPIHSDQDLEAGLLRALAARARAGSGRAFDLARRIVMEPGRAEPLLACLPESWLVENAVQIAQATPAAAASLIGSALRARRPWEGLAPSAARDETLGQRLEWFVDDASVRQQVLSLVDALKVSPPEFALDAGDAAAAQGPGAQIASLLAEPPSEERRRRLYEAGVAAFASVKEDPEDEAAAGWMARALAAAAAAGHAQAWVDLGRCAWNGWGVPVDRDAALRCYQTAAGLGSDYGAYVAAHNLYWVFERDREAYAYALQALAGRDPDGDVRHLLGLMAYNGRGRAKDDAESLLLHTEAAARGNADALFELHVFHAQGIACPVDQERAADFLRRAAARGQARACYTLGALHATGRWPTVGKDMVRAVEWYERAAEGGHGKAAATLAAMFLGGLELGVNLPRGKAMLARAAEAGFDAAGFMAGLGVRADRVAALDGQFDAARSAIRAGDAAGVKAVLDAGMPADIVGGPGLLLLTVAVQEANAEIIRLLVERGADPNRPEDAPLVMALRQRDLATADLLLEAGADVNHGGARYGSALMHFASDDRLDAVRWLLDHGAEPGRRSRRGETPLMSAAREGQVEVVRLLLERGADPNAYTEIDFGLGVVTRDSALGMAEYGGHAAVVALLTAAGARRE
jgi:TPR repeat protein